MTALTWQDVFQVHRKIRAAYVEGGQMKSMLFSPDRRRARLNYKKEDTLYFCFNSASSEAKQIGIYLKVGDTFTVYEKIAPDTWEDIGRHRCVAIGDGEDASNRECLVVEASPVNK